MTSLIEIYKRFPTHESCVKHLELVRWNGQPICPFCGGTKVAKKTEAAQQSRHQCWACSKSFSVTQGTIFHNTHVDLQKWFLLISLMFSAKKGLSAMQASRDLEMRRPTVWKMMHKVRAAMQDDGVLLSGIIEMDETYVGGKPRKKGRKDDNDPKGGDTSKRGRGTDKIPVVGAVERGGKVKTKAVDKTELASDEMKALFMRFVDAKTSVLNTDEYTGYNSMNQVVLHRRVNHAREYTACDLFNGQYGVIHTNTIEGYWAIVKRAIYGQFHHVSPKYLPLYLNELSYRFNQRQNVHRFDDLLHIAVKP